MARAVAAAAVLALAILAARGTRRRGGGGLGGHRRRCHDRLAGEQLLEARPEATAVYRRRRLRRCRRGSGRRRGRTDRG